MTDTKQLNINIDAYCTKHPAKKLEFFCLSNEYQERLFCSNCILKNQIPCKQSDLIDIEEFLISQKQIQDTKGGNQFPEKKRREMEYSSVIQEELQKFNEFVNIIQERVNNQFKQLRKAIENEFISKENLFVSNSNQLQNSINNSYQTSLIGHCKTFDEVLQQFDVNSCQGIKDLMIALMEVKFNEKGFKDEKNRLESSDEIKKQYAIVQSLEKQNYQISEEQLNGIERAVKQLEDKIGSAIANLVSVYSTPNGGDDLSQSYITGRDITNQRNSLNESALNQSFIMNQTIAQMQENALQNVKISDIRKVVCSADFVSGHSRQISSICAYGQNKVATGSEDNTVRLWDLETMECLMCLRGHTQGIRDLISLPNGFIVSASYDKLIKVWNTSQTLINLSQSNNSPTQSPTLSYSDNTSQYIVKTLKGHLSGVICLLYLSGQLLASGSADYTIKIWDLETGDTLKTISGHTGEVLCLCQPFKIILSKKFQEFENSRCLISGSSDKTIKVWKLNKKNNTAIELRNLVDHNDYVNSLLMLPDDSTLISGSHDKIILIWNIHTGQNIGRLEGHTSYITKLNLFAERIVISSSTDSLLKFWDINIKSCVHTLEGHDGPVNTFCILPDQSIWSVGSDKNVHVWD